ncbi:hypothetical protein [Streptomyces sp. NBC_01803]|uniref:hypothetical protein n=1 Tax=Streptomyces sp. NBC_01803 TaxID=2975946 RepID=UPI002DDA9203|nr:hypothetical protein [Streptomyces sp. NBC_01803]WSA46972.1 hypothetical protein OIE51_24005 [Streptomyces sp. NBC_01803]
MDFKIRENRSKAQGREVLVREREEYFRLMDQGLTSRAPGTGHRAPGGGATPAA